MNGLLVFPLISGNKKNIGDYIQSLAQEQFWEKIDCFVERESLSSFTSNEMVNLIMQGWFMWNPDAFPPSKDINPFFISFHLQPLIADKLLNERSVAYLKNYEPIGCRDYQTLKKLESKGIACYFSNCLTLTLGLKYKSSSKNDDIFIVDPHVEIGGSKQFHILRRILNIVITIGLHYNKIRKLKKVFVSHQYNPNTNIKNRLYSFLILVSYYYTYSQIFDDDLLLNAKYVTHIIDDNGSLSEHQKLNIARDLIKKYASSKLIVTSRIHASLPALALETPTIFITSSNLDRGSTGAPGGRFDGIIDLMNTFIITAKGIIPGPNNKIDNQQGKIGRETKVVNSNKYKLYKEDLMNRVKAFVEKCK